MAEGQQQQAAADVAASQERAFAEAVPSRSEALTEIGSSGLRRQGGFVFEEFHKDLRGPKAMQVYREMAANDAVVGAILLLVELMVREVSWTVQPSDGSQDPEDVKWAEFVSQCLDDMSHPFNDVIADAITEVTYGWAYCETVYKVRGGPDAPDPSQQSRFSDGLIGWRKLPLRAQDSLYLWDFDDSGGIQGMQQQAWPAFALVDIPIAKALLFRTSATRGNPEGRSLLRPAYRAWWMKKRLEEFEAIGVERDLAGLPVAWVPPELLAPEATEQQKSVAAEFRRIVVNLRRDAQEGLVLPLVYDKEGHKRYDLTLLTTGGQRQHNTDAIVNRYDKRIATAILADIVLLGQEAIGSFALASSKSNVLAIALNALLDGIGGVFNRIAIPRLLRLNGARPAHPPILVHGDLETIPLDELGVFIEKLSGAGMPLFPDEGLEAHLRKLVGLPARAQVGA